jgi:predicted nucleotidyltransferase
MDGFTIDKRNLLFGLIPSKLKINILGILFSNPGKEYYYQEIVDQIGKQQRGSVVWALKRLEEYGYIVKTVSGKRKFYKINVNNPIYLELRSIWMKTVGIFARLEEHLEPLRGKIDFAFVYGSFAAGAEQAESDIDLMIVGRVKGAEVSKALSDLSVDLGREINYSVFSVEEVLERLKKGDHFWTRLSGEEKVFLIGDPNEFARMGN